MGNDGAHGNVRSPKHLTGPALGLPSLTFRAWFEARFGAAAWQALDKIDRLQWMDYLVWRRRVVALNVRNDLAVETVLPASEGFVTLRIRPQGK
jgi:FAD-dependent urate hydroxylase